MLFATHLGVLAPELEHRIRDGGQHLEGDIRLCLITDRTLPLKNKRKHVVFRRIAQEQYLPYIHYLSYASSENSFFHNKTIFQGQNIYAFHTFSLKTNKFISKQDNISRAISAPLPLFIIHFQRKNNGKDRRIS